MNHFSPVSSKPAEVAAEYSGAEFRRLVARETNDVELKTGVSGKKLQEALVAMSNTEGGSIFIGVTDDRVVVGRKRDQGVNDATHEAALAAVHLGRYDISTATVDGIEIIVIDVDLRPDEVSQTSDGRVLKAARRT